MQFWSLSRQVFQLWSQNPFHFIRFNVTKQAITGPLTSFHRSVSGSVMVLVRFLLVNLNAFACFCERWVSLSWWASLILNRPFNEGQRVRSIRWFNKPVMRKPHFHGCRSTRGDRGGRSPDYTRCFTQYIIWYPIDLSGIGDRRDQMCFHDTGKSPPAFREWCILVPFFVGRHWAFDALWCIWWACPQRNQPPAQWYSRHIPSRNQAPQGNVEWPSFTRPSVRTLVRPSARPSVHPSVWASVQASVRAPGAPVWASALGARGGPSKFG